MNQKIRNITLILFLIMVVVTIVIYFFTDSNIKYMWYSGGVAVMFYLMYRFSK